MQLILETEGTADISVKMTTIEESLDSNLKDTIESLKNDICNGNKENIECQKNIITKTLDDIDGDHKEYSDDNEPELPSPAQDTKLELEINNDDHPKSTSDVEDVNLELEIKKGAGEEVSSNGNSYEISNSNGIHSGDILNGDEEKCKENAVVKEKEAKAEIVVVNDIVKQKSGEISFCSKEYSNVDDKCGKSKEKEDTQFSQLEANIENTDLVTKVLNILDTEMELDNTEDKADNSENLVEVLENKTSLMTGVGTEVDEEISEMALEVDKTIAEMAMQIDEDVLEEISPVDEKISEEAILIDEDESDYIAPKADDLPENVVPIKSGVCVEVSVENIIDVDLVKADSNESRTVVLDTSEQNKTETVAVSEKTSDKVSENIVPPTLEQIETKAKTVVEKTNDNESGNVAKATSVQAESKPVEEKSDDNESESIVLIASDQSEAATVDEITDDYKSKPVVPDAVEQNEAETKASDKSEIEKIDDDVIQIESEQDSKILENVIEETENDVVHILEKKIEDDAQKNADSDQSMTTADILNTVAKGSSENKSDKIDCNLVASELIQSIDDKVEVLDVEDFKELPEIKKQTEEPKVDTPTKSVKADEPKKAHILKLYNTLDILSDDEEDQPQTKSQKTTETTFTEKQCINIEDDDDIMVIEEDTDLSKESKTEPISQPMDTEEEKKDKTDECSIDLENEAITETKKVAETVAETKKDPVVATTEVKVLSKDQVTTETIKDTKEEIKVPPKPLLPENFLKSCKKNLADMTRDELEEFCILKIVESIVDRSNLGEIKSKLKSMAQNIDEHKKKAMMLTKQNRDLQLVLKSVQEEQKKKPDTAITPLKITRSVGMQVLMTEKVGARKKPNNHIIPLATPNANARNIRTPNQSPRAQKPVGNQQIPVPRLVPAAANPVAKSPMTQNSPINTQVKTANQFNGPRMSPPVQKAEKRPHNRLQSVTVDLTDDEPPAKVTPRSSPAPPVRLVSPQNLMSTPRPQLTTSLNSPRKVYIPISGPQGQNIRPGQTIMLKSMPSSGPRPRSAVPNIARGPTPNVIKRVQNNRHPAPLPDAMKQYQPPNWKALPPAPDLKLSKVENGIVISWKIEGYQEDSYEEIASYQLYAYQETSSPPSTAFWKKIGDVKALPLPMACTLTQFSAGFKYYFAVRAVDVRSRLGPFSLPGSILLLNKM